MNRPAAPAALARHVPLCVVRGAIAAGAAVVLALGLGLLVWAVTPASGSAWSVAKGALGVLGAANFISPSIGGISVTLAPLMLTLGCAALVASAAVRSDDTLTVADETVGAVVAGLVYSVVIVAVVAALAPSGSAGPAHALGPIVFGAVVGVVAAIVRGRAWRRLLHTVPAALRTGIRAAVGVVAALVTAGALAVAVGVLLDLPTAIELSRQIAPTVGGGLGMLLVGIVLLPNAAVAGAGYVGLVGFRFAGGSYSPLGTTAAELPAMPLFAAVPGEHGIDPIALAWLVVPLAAAAWAGLRIRRQFADAADRALAVAVAAAVTGIGVALLGAIAGGGLVGRQSLVLAIPVGPLAAVLAAVVALIAGALCALPDRRGRANRSAAPTDGVPVTADEGTADGGTADGGTADGGSEVEVTEDEPVEQQDVIAEPEPEPEPGSESESEDGDRGEPEPEPDSLGDRDGGGVSDAVGAEDASKATDDGIGDLTGTRPRPSGSAH